MTPPSTTEANGGGAEADGARWLPVVLVGHGATASTLLDAAKAICSSGFEDVYSVDAGSGDCAALSERLREVMGCLGDGPEPLIIVDIVGSSPWRRCVRSVMDRRSAVVLGGLSLSMLLKLATVDRRGADAKIVADACAGSAKRAIVISDVRAEG